MRAQARKLFWRVVKRAARPDQAISDFIAGRPGVAFQRRLEWDAFDRPHYAYALHRAATEARYLNVPAISAIELGVAGGAGLLALERIAAEVTAETGTEVQVFGFDTATGMPPPKDYRDLPNVWQEGFYDMDVGALRARLGAAEVIVGQVEDTIPAFIAGNHPPIGFIAFDLDYYSSTRAAMPLLQGPAESIMPRVPCYFDDVISGSAVAYGEHTGELLAIREFNAENEGRKLDRIHGLEYKRRVRAAWNIQIYVCHCFDHRRYTDHLGMPLHSLTIDSGKQTAISRAARRATDRVRPNA